MFLIIYLLYRQFQQELVRHLLISSLENYKKFLSLWLICMLLRKYFFRQVLRVSWYKTHLDSGSEYFAHGYINKNKWNIWIKMRQYYFYWSSTSPGTMKLQNNFLRKRESLPTYYLDHWRTFCNLLTVLSFVNSERITAPDY